MWWQAVLAKFSRITSSGNMIPEIDGLRFIAILTVVLYHLHGYVSVKLGVSAAGTILPAILREGHFGVQLFFAISGFILAIPFAECHLSGDRDFPSLRGYYLRRLTRLEPPYLINLLLLWLCTLSAKGYTSENSWGHLASSALYVHGQIYGSMSTINAVFWSLEVEVQFYLLAPALASVFLIKSRTRRRSLLFAAILAWSVWAVHFMPPVPRLQYSLLGHLQYFLVGFLLTDLYVLDWHRPPQRKLAWDAAVAAATLGALWMLTSKTGLALLPLCVFTAYCGVFRGVAFRSLISLPPVVTIGGMCYTIYLYHYHMINLLSRVLLPPSPSWPLGLDYALRLLLISFVTLGACSVLFLLLERPFMKRDWHKAFLSRTNDSRAGASQPGIPGYPSVHRVGCHSHDHQAAAGRVSASNTAPSRSI